MHNKSHVMRVATIVKSAVSVTAIRCYLGWLCATVGDNALVTENTQQTEPVCDDVVEVS